MLRNTETVLGREQVGPLAAWCTPGIRKCGFPWAVWAEPRRGHPWAGPLIPVQPGSPMAGAYVRGSGCCWSPYWDSALA